MERAGMTLTNGRPNLAALLLTLIAGLACTGCFGTAKKPAKRFVPPPAPRANAVPTAKPFTAEMMAIPPDAEPESVEFASVVPVQLPMPLVPKPVQRPAARITPPPAAPAPVIPTPPAPGPQLGELLSPGDRKQAEIDFLAMVQRARGSLERTEKRPLTAGQRDTVERIRVFLTQAENEKNRDIATAVQLARRADLLGQDLLRSLSQ